MRSSPSSICLVGSVAPAPTSSALALEPAPSADGEWASWASHAGIFFADIAINSPTQVNMKQQRQRAVRKANKLKQRLGIGVGVGEPFPDKPKGMWTRTYGSLLNEILHAEILANEARSNMFKRLTRVKNDR